MTRDEIVSLFNKGRGAWNGWARSLLKQRDSLIEKGEWEQLSHVDFSHYNFGTERLDFSRFIFPNTVDFSQAIFPPITSFNEAVFHGEADFYGAHFQRHATFVSSFFKKTPNFTSVLFETPPHILDMKVKRPPIFNKNYRHNMNDPEKFSVLSKLAQRAGDSKLAHHFHGSAIVARRHITEQWWQAGFWAGIKYQIFSNFGQSLMRPFLAWFGSIFLFTWFYLNAYKPVKAIAKPLEPSQLESFWNSTKSWFVPSAEQSIFKLSCAADEGGILIKAFYLSVKNAFLNLGGSTEKVTQVYACLYGINPNYSKAGIVPFIPDNVAMLSLLQMLISAVLCFFFALALYKRFSIK